MREGVALLIMSLTMFKLLPLRADKLRMGSRPSRFLHDMHRKKYYGVMVKVDFEKSYGDINWNFLCEIMKKGFSDKVVDMVTIIMVDGKVCMR